MAWIQLGTMVAGTELCQTQNSGQGRGMVFEDGAPNLEQHTILVATADLEPQAKEDIMCLGIIKQGVGLLNAIPGSKILVGVVVDCIWQADPNLDW